MLSIVWSFKTRVENEKKTRKHPGTALPTFPTMISRCLVLLEHLCVKKNKSIEQSQSGGYLVSNENHAFPRHTSFRTTNRTVTERKAPCAALEPRKIVRFPAFCNCTFERLETVYKRGVRDGISKPDRFSFLK